MLGELEREEDVEIDDFEEEDEGALKPLELEVLLLKLPPEEKLLREEEEEKPRPPDEKPPEDLAKASMGAARSTTAMTAMRL